MTQAPERTRPVEHPAVTEPSVGQSVDRVDGVVKTSGAARYAAERRRIEERWGPALHVDPSVNPTWHQATLPFRLLSMPSSERLWRHIRMCASEDPWFPATDQSEDRAPPDRVATGTGGD